MSFLVVQGGNTLYKVDPSSGSATALTLPSGVTLSTTRKPRFAILNQFVALVNSPSQNLVIDPEGTVRLMVPRAPVNAPNLAAGSGTGYTGSRRIRCSFIVKGSDDSLLMESALSPAGPAVSFTNKDMAITRIPLSVDSISARRIYTTLDSGTAYFFLMDVDGNTGTSALSAISDAGLSVLPALDSGLVAPAGTYPGSRMKTIVSWKQRLWGVADDPAQVDTIAFTDSEKVYAWANSVVAYPKGQDSEGVVGFAPRKDQLGVLKRDGVWQVTGSASGSAGISTSSVVIVQLASGRGGCIAPDSIIVINDRAYWLSDDGVWEWSSEGIRNISDDAVKPWFERVVADNTSFNPARFANAFAKYNAKTNCYDLHLAAAGSSTEDRWVSFCLTNRKWYGPHKTGALTPSHAGLAKDANNLPIALVGGTDGVLYVGNQSTLRDGSGTAIDMDCYGPWHSDDAPDDEHFWGQLSLLTKVESGGTLSVTPTVGRLNSSAQSAISHSLTTGRELLRRLGDGALCRLRMQQATVNQGAVIYGYEIDPVFTNGKR